MGQLFRDHVREGESNCSVSKSRARVMALWGIPDAVFRSSRTMKKGREGKMRSGQYPQEKVHLAEAITAC